MRPLVINADDYAMAPAVDDAVLALAARGIVTSTSAMVLAPGWPASGRRLAPTGLDCGLHLDFTSGFAHAAGCGYPLGTLIARAYSGRLDATRLQAAVCQQLDRFEEQAGGPPRFIDGHQHVHQLPVIRQAWMAVVEQRYGDAARAIAVRSCRPMRWRGLKAAVVGALGARALNRAVTVRARLINSDFVGVYGLNDDADLPALWAGWLAHLQGPLPLAMCHVARPGNGAAHDDAIHAARLQEYAWLSSAAFQDLLAQRGIAPARWQGPPR